MNPRIFIALSVCLFLSASHLMAGPATPPREPFNQTYLNSIIDGLINSVQQALTHPEEDAQIAALREASSPFSTAISYLIIHERLSDELHARLTNHVTRIRGGTTVITQLYRVRDIFQGAQPSYSGLLDLTTLIHQLDQRTNAILRQEAEMRLIRTINQAIEDVQSALEQPTPIQALQRTSPIFVDLVSMLNTLRLITPAENDQLRSYAARIEEGTTLQTQLHRIRLIFLASARFFQPNTQFETFVGSLRHRIHQAMNHEEARVFDAMSRGTVIQDDIDHIVRLWIFLDEPAARELFLLRVEARRQLQPSNKHAAIDLIAKR